MTIEIFMWVMSVALLPIIGWAIHQSWSIRRLVDMHEHPEKNGFSTKGLDVIPGRIIDLEKTLNDMRDRQGVVLGRINTLTLNYSQTVERLDDLKHVISQNTEAMRELVTLIRIMDARLDKNSIKVHQE